MKLSMWMLYDWLHPYDPQPKITDGSQVLRGVRILSQDTVIEKQNVYIANAAEFISGEKDKLICVHGQDMILVNSDDMEAVLNAVFDAFDYYNSWADGIAEEIADGCSAQTLVDKSSQIFRQPLLLYNSGNEIIGISSEYPLGSLDAEWDTILQTGTNSLDFLMNIQKILQQQRNYHEVHRFSMPGTPYHSVYRSLFLDRAWVGRAILLEVFHELTRGELQLFDYFGEMVERWARSSDRIARLPEETAVFLKLLEKEPVSRAEIDYRLQMDGWKKEQEKVLIRVEIPQTNNEISRSVFLRMERVLEEAYVIFSPEVLYILANLQITPLEQIRQSISGILTESELCAVISSAFTDVFALSGYNQQCALTYRYVPRLAGQFYACENYALECIRSYIRTSVPGVLKHAALQTLKVYDGKNDSELYETLYCYLRNNCNMAQTARSLHLHRNSLLYRLNQIREITGIRLEEADVREHLLLSFYM